MGIKNEKCEMKNQKVQKPKLKEWI